MEKKTAKKRKFWTPKSPKKNEVEPVRDMLRGISISRTQSCDETALIIIAKHGFEKFVTLRSACHHVPATFPNRVTFIKNIVFDLNIPGCEVEEFAASCYATKQTGVDQMTDIFQSQLLKASSHFGEPYMVFQVPNVDSCLFCGGMVYGEKPARVTIFTLQGPFPGLKSSLKCRRCHARFNADMYHEVSGPSFYYPNPEMACGNIVQASNRVGFTKDLYELLCESGNHAFVSAQAFAEIYNTVFARHISLVDQKTRQDPHSEYLNEPQCQVFMTRKNTMEAFFNGELENELRDRKLVDTVSFSEDASREKVMKHIDTLRRTELYPHPQDECSEKCKQRANPGSHEDIQRVDEKVLAFMHKLMCKDERMKTTGSNAVTFQGTDKLVRKFHQHVLNSNQELPSCNKDTGEKSRLRQRSRGHFVTVTGGGHILQFNPLFKSESPSQAFMLIVQMMYSELKELTEDEQRRRLQDYTLCYDNICNVDALGAAKEDLPLPGPLSDMWKTVKKVIDRLHIRNHKDQKCHELYHPDDNLPSSYNTMAGEQTFAWMSRFKKIVNSMTQTHHLFFLHRMCVRRNKYTSSCFKEGREPVLPGVNRGITSHGL
uniref:CxC5 like cysteine cluster associated with KDZ domain-containing protein n=1 Tax=Magallana gigas TaxID=29159 RepID=K1R507_MAGGI